MFRLETLSITKKLGLLIGGALLGVVAIAGVFLATERQLILAERQHAVRQTVELAHALAGHYHAQVQTGGLGEAEARQRALAAIKALRYGGSEYFWINDLQPRMVMHPTKPELDGQDLSTHRDPNGLTLFVEMVRTVRAQGAGFVHYAWPKPGSDRPVPKLSYVQGFAPWGWVLGSGVYIDTVDATVAAEARALALYAAVLVAALLALGLAIGRSLLRQLGGEPAYAGAVTQRIAAGDLQVDVALRPGDRSSLLHAIRHMRDEIGTIVARVRQSAECVATASGEIAQGNLDLSQRTEQQASALQQTAASMEQLSATVQGNAGHAAQAHQLSREAADVARRGGAVVAEVVTTMQGIHDGARRIADITGVIDGIAFQTNLLALNAAVEAAQIGRASCRERVLLSV